MEPGGIGSDVLGRAKPEQGEPSVEQRRVASEVRSVLFGENERMRIGRFVVEEPLGQGGMGVVYAAHDPDLDRRVAVKLLSRADADGFEARLRLEAQAMARLSHPNVAVVHEVGSHEGRVFVAMELVDGVTLRAWADDHARSWREILDVYLQAGDGLVAAHEAGLVHRDFKPDNAMLGTDGRVRVLDFGLASSRRHEEGIDDRDTRIARDRLTETGTLLGTPAYMAPEQIDGGGVDTRSDQFAFCVALFEALYGVRPYSGRTVGELGEAIGAGHIAAPKRSVGPAWLRRVLQRLSLIHI